MAIKIPTRATQDIGLTTQTADIKADLSDSSPEMEALGNIGKAIGQSAGYISRYAEIRKKQIIDDELTAAQIADADAYNEFVASRENDPDYINDMDEYNTWSENNSAAILDTFTDKTARKKFSEYLQHKHLERTVAVREAQRQRQADDVIDRLPDKIDGLVRTDDTNGAHTYVENLRDLGFLDEAAKNYWQGHIVKAAAKKYINEFTSNIFTEAEAGEKSSGGSAVLNALKEPAELKKLIKERGLNINEADLEEVVEELTTEAVLKNADEKLRLTQARQAQTASVMGKIDNREFEGIREFIYSQPDLTPNQQKELDDKALERAQITGQGKKDPFKESDLKVYFDLRKKIGRDTGSVTEAGLVKKVGKGLSISDYQKLSEMLKDDKSPLIRPSVIRAHEAVSRLGASEISMLDKKAGRYKDKVRAIETESLKIQRQLDDWVKDHQDEADFEEKLEKKVKFLTAPKIEQVTLNWFKKLMNPKKDFSGPLYNTEAEEPAQEKMDMLKDHSIWNTLSSQERKEAARAFENGYTVQDVIDELKGLEEAE